eukprot:gene30087-37246_t
MCDFGFGDDSEEHFAYSQTIKVLNLSGGLLLSNFNNPHGYVNLQVLNLSCCYTINPHALTSDISPSDIVTMLSHFVHLTDINLSQLLALTDSAVDQISLQFPDLKSLTMSRCPLITVASVHTVLRNCLRLEVLDVRGCRSVTPPTDDQFRIHSTASILIDTIEQHGYERLKTVLAYLLDM